MWPSSEDSSNSIQVQRQNRTKPQKICQNSADIRYIATTREFPGRIIDRSQFFSGFRDINFSGKWKSLWQRAAASVWRTKKCPTFLGLVTNSCPKKNLNTGMMIFCCFSQMLIVLLMVTSCDWTSITLLDITDIGFHETKSEEGKRMWLWTLVGI